MTISNEGAYTELRKVQITGKSSYTIVLPKKWIEDNSVKKGDLVTLNNIDGELIITKFEEPEKKKEKSIPKIIIDDLSDSELILLIQGAYTHGLDSIEILSTKKRMDPSRKGMAVDAIQELIGFEVISDSGNSIIVKNILEPSDFNIKDVGNRLHNHVWDMYEIVVNYFVEKNPKIVEDIETREKVVKRLYLLTQRLLTIGISNKVVARKIGLKDSRDATYWSKIIRILSWNSGILLEMVHQLDSIKSLNIPNEFRDFFKWLVDLLPSLEFRYSGIFSKNALENVFETLRSYEYKKLEEIRKKLLEKSLNPKLQLHIENIISLLQNLYKNCYNYLKDLINAVYWEPPNNNPLPFTENR